MVVTGVVGRQTLGDREHYKRKCAELEDVVESCLSALTLIPINQLKQGHTWIPSDIALRKLEKAKDSCNEYARIHFQGQ